MQQTEDITIARLVLEDWRFRIEQRGADLHLSDHELLEFVTGLGKKVLADNKFTISRKEIHERLSANSGSAWITINRLLARLPKACG